MHCIWINFKGNVLKFMKKSADNPFQNLKIWTALFLGPYWVKAEILFAGNIEEAGLASSM
jgi:hypothetical protein